MARRKPSTEDTTTNPTEEVTVSTTTEDVTETPTDTATETPAVEEVVDISSFEAALQEALGTADESTGTVPDGDVSKAAAAYQALEGPKAKAAARARADELVKELMQGMEFLKARSVMQVKDNLKAGAAKSTKAPKAPVDPTEGFVDTVAALVVAATVAQQVVPEGVAETWADDVNAKVAEADAHVATYTAWLDSDAEDKGDAPEVPAYVVSAVKIARGKSAKASTRTRAAYSGPTRSVAKHIEEAFADVPSGTFLSVADIRKHNSTEYGENDRPSAGALSARLFPKSGEVTIEGVTPTTNEAGVKGATKN